MNCALCRGRGENRLAPLKPLLPGPVIFLDGKEGSGWSRSIRENRPQGACLVLVAIWATAGALPSRAQEDPHAACAAPPAYVPAELLTRELPLRKGVGNSSETITTQSKEAQAYYNQGLNYLESYVWIEASRSFHQALRLDPTCAMANLGLSYVYSGLENPDGRETVLRQGEGDGRGPQRPRTPPPRHSREAALRAGGHQGQRALSCLQEEHRRRPGATLDDPVLWILRGNAEEVNAAAAASEALRPSVAFYNAVLALVPDHATAHHYLVHSIETIGRIDRALEHGDDYARLSPAIPHSAHMWGHDLRRVADVDDAIAQFKRTDEIERAYYAAEKIDPAMDWHHAHNLDLLASCYQHKGQVKLAEATAREAVSLSPPRCLRHLQSETAPGFSHPSRSLPGSTRLGARHDCARTRAGAHRRTRAGRTGLDRTWTGR